VKAWRDRGYEDPAETSKSLLRWWFAEAHLNPAAYAAGTPMVEFRYFFAQREALETIVYLYDVVGVEDKYDLMGFDSSGAATKKKKTNTNSRTPRLPRSPSSFSCFFVWSFPIRILNLFRISRFGFRISRFGFRISPNGFAYQNGVHTSGRSQRCGPGWVCPAYVAAGLHRHLGEWGGRPCGGPGIPEEFALAGQGGKAEEPVGGDGEHGASVPVSGSMAAVPQQVGSQPQWTETTSVTRRRGSPIFKKMAVVSWPFKAVQIVAILCNPFRGKEVP
jgi:hypothetical protein